MLFECSYGIVPLRKKENSWDVLLIQHAGSGYWGLPKGHGEPDEQPQETAIRELFEETHLTVIRFLSDIPLRENYIFKLHGNLVYKTVEFFVAEVKGCLKLQIEEVRDYKWVLLSSADQYLTYKSDQSICRDAANLLKEI